MRKCHIFKKHPSYFLNWPPLFYPAIVCHLPALKTLQDSPEGGANLELKGAILAPTTVPPIFILFGFMEGRRALVINSDLAYKINPL